MHLIKEKSDIDEKLERRINELEKKQKEERELDK